MSVLGFPEAMNCEILIPCGAGMKSSQYSLHTGIPKIPSPRRIRFIDWIHPGNRSLQLEGKK
jgi:hypothetical protein